MARTTIKLTQDLRNKVDACVLETLSKTVPTTASALAVGVQRQLGDALPKRNDFFRYVDASVQRLREKAKIKPASNSAVGGRGGWLLP